VATNTSFILSVLEENLGKYRPNMVIAMIGINDKGTHMPHEPVVSSSPVRFFRSFKTYKLVRLLVRHINYKIEEAKRLNAGEKNDNVVLQQKSFASAKRQKDLDVRAFVPLGEGILEREKMSIPRDEQGYIELGKLFTSQEKITLAKKAFRNAISVNPKSTDAVFRLVWLSEESEAQELIKNLTGELEKAIEMNPRDTVIINNYFHLGCYLVNRYQRYIEAEKLFKKLVAIDSSNCMAHIMLGVCFAGQGQYALAENTLKKAQALDSNGRALTELAVLYHETGRYQLAEQSARKARELNPLGYLPLTVYNYKEIKRILDKKKIRLVCVQYPLRPIAPLKKIFADEQNIIFVDNERIFREALINTSYKAYFRDMFAGDFGHCTDIGNRLLAKNIADVILKEVFGK